MGVRAATLTAMRGAPGRTCLALCTVMIAALAIAQGAAAQTTHKYLESWSTPPGSKPEVQAVDGDGNVYVYNLDANTLARYGPDGTPLPFSALGTNTIDGSGGLDCPATPSDCDRVPANEIVADEPNTSTSVEIEHLAVVDTSGGPADGYIYILNFAGGPVAGSFAQGAIEVFAPSGQFLGEIDQTSFPENHDPYREISDVRYTGLSMDANGTLYVSYSGSTDRFSPVDSDPTHDLFNGQIRHGSRSTSGPAYTYAFSNTGLSATRQYANSAFAIESDPQPFLLQGSQLFGDGGADPEFNNNFGSLEIDPAVGDVFLINRGAIEEWNPTGTSQIGQRFGVEARGVGLAFDHSGGLTEGRLYTRGEANGADSVAVFSGEVTIPDISDLPAALGHEEATVSARIGLDGGPPVTDCKVEYGKQLVPLTTRPAYELGSLPCDVTPPYAGETEVSVELGGLEPEVDYFYRFLATNENGTTEGPHRIARPAAVLAVEAKPATDITKTTATLRGSLDPDGLETEYRFEYGVTTNYEESTQSESVGPTSGVVDLTPTPIGELQPGRTYHYRVVATNSIGTTVSADRTFVAASPPRITGVRTSLVTVATARLHGKVNPFGYETSYRFEYGLTQGYGASIPASDVGIGDGTTPEDVSADLAGLQPAVYHFRIAATNQWGTTYSEDTTFSFKPPNCPNSQVRQVTGAAYLPDCRAYELVSPGNAAGVQLFTGSMVEVFGGSFTGLNSPNSPYRLSSSNTGLARSPSRFSYWGAFGSLPGTDTPNSLIDMYVSTRTPEGWVSTYPGMPGSQASASLRPHCNEALDVCLSYKGAGPFASVLENPHSAPYLWDSSGNSVSLGRWPTNLGIVPGGEDYVGDDKPSADFSHYVFSSRDLAFAPAGLATSPGSVYDNDAESGTISIASKLAGGADIAKDGGGPDEVIRIAAVSADGSHILMTTEADDGPNDVYLRVDGTVTYEIGAGIRVIGMTRSGHRVVFVSNKRLTADDTDTSADLFVWNEGTGSLTRISQGNGQGDSDSCATTWVSKCGVQEVATRRPDTDNQIARNSGDVYFYSPENLDDGTPGVRNQRNLYAWNNGQVRLVATLDPDRKATRLQVSGDGERAAFVTATELTGYDSAGFEMMYAFDAATQSVRCVSCLPNGDPPGADVEASDGGLFMSDDGRAFFSTTDALVPQDTNGGIVDIYEYAEGRPQMLSSGTGLVDVNYGGLFYPDLKMGLEGVSADGVDVYFSSFETLVPQDHNGLVLKFYDARTNGGFLPEVELLPCVAADECHGPGSSRPGSPQIGSGAALPVSRVANTLRKRKNRRRRQLRHKRAMRKRAAKAKRSRARAAGRKGGRRRG